MTLAAAVASSSEEEPGFVEFCEEIFDFEEPPLVPAFALKLPAPATTQAIALLNTHRPLSARLRHCDRCLFPESPVSASAPEGLSQLQRQIGVYVPTWRSRLSFQHLKRCRSLRKAGQAQARHSVLLLGESPVRVGFGKAESWRSTWAGRKTRPPG